VALRFEVADGMRLGIDGSNLRVGGGMTHLVELLGAAQPQEHGIASVMVWGDNELLRRIPDQPWLHKSPIAPFDRSSLARLYWQQVRLPALAARTCDLLFVPGGNYRGNFHPVVTMCRNLLPFEDREIRRYRFSRQYWKLRLLRWGLSRSFRRADGVIFLTAYARSVILQHLLAPLQTTTIVSHGLDGSFRCRPRPQKPMEAYSAVSPFRLLYVSTVDLYKHQWHVAAAVSRLQKEGWAVTLDLVGPSYAPALRRLNDTLSRLDPAGIHLRYLGPVAYADLPAIYRQADAFVFASSCENMPNVLLEAMAAGLPIACARRGPMPEILGDAGVYFDPEQPDEMASVLRAFLSDPAVRQRCASAAFDRSQAYSWQHCAEETFAFLAGVARASAAGATATVDGNDGSHARAESSI
jgi:glycosyltransferase involved in cell wall biosynthesis